MEETGNYTQSVQPHLKVMKVGEITDFPITRVGTVKNSCSYIGLQYGRKFKTSLDRANEVIRVTRIK